MGNRRKFKGIFHGGFFTANCAAPHHKKWINYELFFKKSLSVKICPSEIMKLASGYRSMENRLNSPLMMFLKVSDLKELFQMEK